MYGHSVSKLANHQIRHQATHKVGCQPGDCMFTLIFLWGLCGHVWVNILTLSSPPRRKIHYLTVLHFLNCITDFYWAPENDFMMATLGGDSMLAHTDTWGWLNWPSAITRLTVRFTHGLMSNLMTCKRWEEYDCTWHWMTLLRPVSLNNTKLKLKLS